MTPNNNGRKSANGGKAKDCFDFNKNNKLRNSTRQTYQYNKNEDVDDNNGNRNKEKRIAEVNEHLAV